MSDRDPIHEMKNHLSIVLGFVELLLADMDADDKRRGDLSEIKQAADRAMTLLPELSAARKDGE